MKYSGVSKWNLLPENIMTSHTLNVFKKQIKKWIFDREVRDIGLLIYVIVLFFCLTLYNSIQFTCILHGKPIVFFYY